MTGRLQNWPYIVGIWLGCWWLETATHTIADHGWSPFFVIYGLISEETDSMAATVRNQRENARMAA